MCIYIYIYIYIYLGSLRGSSVNIGAMQRRLAWPLRKEGPSGLPVHARPSPQPASAQSGARFFAEARRRSTLAGAISRGVAGYGSLRLSRRTRTIVVVFRRCGVGRSPNGRCYRKQWSHSSAQLLSGRTRRVWQRLAPPSTATQLHWMKLCVCETVPLPCLPSMTQRRRCSYSSIVYVGALDAPSICA